MTRATNNQVVRAFAADCTSSVTTITLFSLRDINSPHIEVTGHRSLQLLVSASPLFSLQCHQPRE